MRRSMSCPKLKSNCQQTHRQMNNLGLYGGVQFVPAQLVVSMQSKQRPEPDGRLGSGIANGVPLDWRCLSLPEHNIPYTGRTSTEMQLLAVQYTLQSLNLPKDSCCRPTTPWHS
ncbi:hypothetical protein CGCSCA1_v000393 [Colletotrichum siamense]|nr:hypothetical protein CGCSCA1_v000393 [Colletotrichum siamense]